MKKGSVLLIVVIATILILLGVRYIVKSYGSDYIPEVNSITQFNNLVQDETDNKNGDHVVVKEESPSVSVEKEVKEKDSNATEKEKVFLPELYVATSPIDKVSIEEVRDKKPMVINYWASWCPPCKMELPGFNKMYSKYKDQVTFMFLSSVDGTRETIDTASTYVNLQGYDFKPYYDIYGFGGTLGLRSLPTTIFILEDGSVAGGVMGAISEENLEKQILEMLN